MAGCVPSPHVKSLRSTATSLAPTHFGARSPRTGYPLVRSCNKIATRPSREIAWYRRFEIAIGFDIWPSSHATRPVNGSRTVASALSRRASITPGQRSRIRRALQTGETCHRGWCEADCGELPPSGKVTPPATCIAAGAVSALVRHCCKLKSKMTPEGGLTHISPVLEFHRNRHKHRSFGISISRVRPPGCE